MTRPTTTVFTPAEVARVLRVTSETVRRKIVSGELGAIEVGGKQRKQYRITLADLSGWLGPERAAQLFGIGAGLNALETAMRGADADALERELSAAVAAVRAEQDRPGPFLPTPTPEDIARKFGQR